MDYDDQSTRQVALTPTDYGPLGPAGKTIAALASVGSVAQMGCGWVVMARGWCSCGAAQSSVKWQRSIASGPDLGDLS